MIERSLIKAINLQIYKRFPEVSGKNPRIQKRKSDQPQTQEKQTYLLTYNGQVQLSAERLLPRSIRVVVDEDGNILKITTSR